MRFSRSAGFLVGLLVCFNCAQSTMSPKLQLRQAPYPNLPQGDSLPSIMVDEFTDSGLTNGGFLLQPTVYERDASTYDPGGGVKPPGPGPASPPYIAEQVFPTGWPSGYYPGTISTGLTSLNWTHVYVALVVQLSSNWYGDASTVNKVMFANIHGDPCFILSATGSGSRTLNWQVRLQDMGLPPTDVNLNADLGHDATAERGVWYRLEVELVANTPGVADGTLRLWSTKYNGDGTIATGPTKILEYTNVGWSAAGQSAVWEGVYWRPVWGGAGGPPVPATQYEWVDRFAVGGH